MACRNHHPIWKIMLHHVEHDQRRRYGTVDEPGFDSFLRPHFTGPVNGLLGQKPAVISNHNPLIRHTLCLHFPRHCLGKNLYIRLGEFFSYDGSPAAGSKLNHMVSLSPYSNYFPYFLLCRLRHQRRQECPITTFISCTLPLSASGIRSTFTPSIQYSFTPFMTPSGFST